MTITLFPKKDSRDGATVVTTDIPDITTGRRRERPSALTLDSPDDKVLLFKGKDYDGGCLFRRGIAFIDLGNPRRGGKVGFGNAVESVRITPFSVKMNAIIIKNSKGGFPGGFTSADDVLGFVNGVFKVTADLWRPFLIELELDAAQFQTDDRHFDVSVDVAVRFPLSFTVKDRVNVFFINSFRNAAGIGLFPWTGDFVAVQIPAIPDPSILDPLTVGYPLAHEFGHYVGLHHPSAKGDRQNIMYASLTTKIEEVTRLTEDQVGDAHACLARNPARRNRRGE